MSLCSRARRRAHGGLVLVSIVVSMLGVQHADAASQTTADGDLSASIDFSGTGSLVSSVATPSLRASAPASGGPRILVLGTGVQRDIFPAALQTSILGSGNDLIDTHGYGTITASTIFQLLPNATITSKWVRPGDVNWMLIDLRALADALEWTRAHAASFDAVVLAFPPQAALDPVSYSIGYGDYGRFGRGMQMVEEALLTTRAPVQGTIAGIPADKTLRDKIFARANLKQHDAVERFAVQAVQWRAVLDKVAALDAAGVPLISPAGDFTRKVGSTIVALPTQTSYGLAALPDVITVGSAYADGSVMRVSPTSGRGPTLGLGAKPDLLAPSNIMAMLPATAKLAWQDDSTRVPLQMLDWAKPGVGPSPCPSVTSVYRCVLQGSSMVSAAVVAANLGSLVASGSPHTAAARNSSDDEVLRGIGWAHASSVQARAFNDDRIAYAWEQGAGVFTGLRGFDATTEPIALARADVGEVRWDDPKAVSVPLWAGGGAVSRASASLDSFIGPDVSGQAVSMPYVDGSRLRSSVSGDSVNVSASGARAQGGIYVGSLTLTTTSGNSVSLPVSLTQTLPVDIHVDYAYNEFQGGGSEGERVEDAGIVLFAGLPTNVGLVGEAFKNFSRVGGDPTTNFILRSAVTQSVFRDPSLPASEHGRAHITDVPPGFYRFHVLTDHAVEDVQARGRTESIGIQLATSGPDGLNQAGANMLLSSCAGSPVDGPLTCAHRDSTTEIDPSSGMCVARNSKTQVAFNVYCGEIGYAVPSAVTSRAVHLIEHDADPARSEWKTCGVNVPTDGKVVDFAAIADQASTCGGTTTPTAWTFPAKAPDCLGPGERARYPGGVPTDVTATYSGAPLPNRNLPAGVLTYEFKLPYLNTYTTAGLSLSYVAENAIVGVRFRAGGDSTYDSSNSILGFDGPAVNVTPAIQNAGARGSSYNEWSVMSANAGVGQLSIIVIPTAWARSDLDPTKPIARVQLCDVALRVSTFSKQTWGARQTDGTQFFPMLDRGLASQIDPSVSRTRPAFSNGAFADAGIEHEDLTFAVQVPKNTTRDASAPHHVRSPIGGPAAFGGARRWGTDALRHENILSSGYTANDSLGGITSLACAENATDPTMAATCKAWNAARNNNGLLAQLGPELSTNGRFAGVLPIEQTTIARAAGNVSYEISARDDHGTFEQRWAASKRFGVGNFYDDLVSTASLDLLNGLIQVVKDAAGNQTLVMRTSGAGGAEHVITAALH